MSESKQLTKKVDLCLRHISYNNAREISKARSSSPIYMLKKMLLTNKDDIDDELTIHMNIVMIPVHIRWSNQNHWPMYSLLYHPPNYCTTNLAHHDHCHQSTNFLPFPAPHLNDFDLVNYSLLSQSQSQSPAPPLLPTLFYTPFSILFRDLPNPSPYGIHNLYYLFLPLIHLLKAHFSFCKRSRELAYRYCLGFFDS